MLNTQDRDFLKLLARSPDRGDGWRNVSKLCWQLVEAFGTPELLEIDAENRRVRLTAAGQAVVEFAI